jgi:hypothetical protein
MKAIASLAAVLAIAAIAVGCGGDDSSADGSGGSSEDAGPVTTASLSKAQYVKQASALCKQRRESRFKEMEAYIQENPGGSEEDRLEGAVEEIQVPTMEAQFDDLRALGAPSGDEKQVEAIIVAYEKAIAAIDEVEGTKGADKVNKLLNRGGELARAYGLVECTYG